MRKLIYRSRGMELVVTDSEWSPYFMDFNRFKPNQKSGIFDTARVYGQNGASTYNRSVSGLSIRMEFTYQACLQGTRNKPVDLLADRSKTFLCEIFNPRYPGVLTYKGYDKTAQLEVTPQAPSADGDYDSATGMIDYAVDFYADKPYWESAEVFEKNIGYVVKGWRFPFRLPSTFGEYIAQAAVTNPGASDIHPILTFRANNHRAAVTNKTTGQLIRIDREIGANQQLVVNTDPFNMSAILCEQNGDNWAEVENAIYWITNDSSEDFKLTSGENMISVNSGGAGNQPACLVQWRIPYEGV